MPARVPVAIVLDPDLGVLRTAEDWLRRGNWTVFTAGDPVEAVRYADALRDELTVLLIDPGLGLESADATVRRIKQSCPSIGVLCICHFDTPCRVGDGRLHKPFTSTQLLDAARSVIPKGMAFSVLDMPRPPSDSGF